MNRPCSRHFALLTLLSCLALSVGASSAQDASSPGHGVHRPSKAEPAAPLTLAAFERIALERNPTLAQAAAQIGAARGKALQAGLCPNPILGYTSEQIGVHGTAGELQGLFVEQEIVTAGKLRLSRSKYEIEAAQAELQLLAQQHRVVSSLHAAYYDVLAAQHLMAIRRELVKNANDVLQTAQELVNVGQANKPDVLQAEIEAQRARVSLKNAERRHRSSWDRLTAVAGAPELAMTTLSGRFEIDDSCVLDREKALAHLLQSSPEMQIAFAEITRDQIALKREQVEPIPNINVRAETGYNFESRDTVAGVSVGFRLPLFDRNQGSIMQAQAELARAHAEVTRLELDLRKRFAEVFGRYETAYESAEDFRKASLPKAREAYETYLDSFKKRRAAWPQVLVAQRNYFQMSEEYVDAVLEMRKALTEIQGLLLGDGLTEPPAPTPRGHLEATPRPR